MFDFCFGALIMSLKEYIVRVKVKRDAVYLPSAEFMKHKHQTLNLGEIN